MQYLKPLLLTKQHCSATVKTVNCNLCEEFWQDKASGKQSRMDRVEVLFQLGWQEDLADTLL